MSIEELSLVDKLKVYQAIKRMNQQELGEGLLVSQSFVSRLLKGEVKPSYELEQRIIKLLKENRLY
jgi:predicted transcriptional regulator